MTTVQTWLLIGFLGQGMFTARFLVQWLASEKKKDSVVPVAFWWLSMAGGLTLLSYAIYREDPVIIAGQSLGVFVYLRNLMLVGKGKRRVASHKPRSADSSASGAVPRPHSVDAATRVTPRKGSIPFT
jgi:lipid-A-disaccharide synthase-like uncharacterized protein